VKKLTDEEEKRALELHQGAIVIDALNASIMDEDYFQKMQQGGVTAINYTVAMNQNLSETVKRIAQLYRQIERSQVTTLIESTADIRQAKQEGQVGIILGFQNVGPLEVDLSLLRIYYKLGVRIIQLTYHFRDVCGDGCKEPANSGLSLFGAVTMPHWGTLNNENTCARGALPHGAGCGTLERNGWSEVGSNLVPRA